MLTENYGVAPLQIDPSASLPIWREMRNDQTQTW